jgi:hypothetical protein
MATPLSVLAAHIRSKIAAMPWPPAQREHDALADHRGHIGVGDADSWLIVLPAARPKFPLRKGKAVAPGEADVHGSSHDASAS